MLMLLFFINELNNNHYGPYQDRNFPQVKLIINPYIGKTSGNIKLPMMNAILNKKIQP